MEKDHSWVAFSDMNQVKYTSLLTCSSTLSSILCQPLQVLLTRQQAGQLVVSATPVANTTNMTTVSTKGIVEGFKNSIKIIGFSGLYRGLVATGLSGIPSQVIYLSVTESSREVIREGLYNHVLPAKTPIYVIDGIQACASSVLANVFSLVPYVPGEVIATRLMIQGKESIGTIGMIKKIYKAEGFNGFYRGFNSAVAVGTVLSTSWWFIYTIIRRNLSSVGIFKGFSLHESTILDGTSGFIAGTAATFIAHPMDTVKTRILTGKTLTSSLTKTFKNIITNEGTGALWKGIRPALANAAVSSCGFALIYEFIKRQSLL